MSLLLAFAVMALLAIPTPAGIQAYAADSAVSQKIADLDEKIAASQEKIKENEAKKKRHSRTQTPSRKASTCCSLRSMPITRRSTS